MALPTISVKTSTQRTTRIAAADFIELERRLRESWGDTDADDYDGPVDISDVVAYPDIIFENGTITVDEMWGVKDGNVWTSSFARGVSSADDQGNQIRSRWGVVFDFGQWVAVDIHSPPKAVATALNATFVEDE